MARRSMLRARTSEETSTGRVDRACVVEYRMVDVL